MIAPAFTILVRYLDNQDGWPTEKSQKHYFNPTTAPKCIPCPAKTQTQPYLTFLLSASTFRNGNPLVLLSAPVLLLILPLSPANIRHHSPKAARTPLPTNPRP